MKALGLLVIFYRDIFRSILRSKQNKRQIFQQTVEVYTRSFSTVVFAGIFVGAILTLQFQLVLADYEALSMLGGITTSACVREVGPLIISFLLAGKIGAFTAAELGTMRVTEQIDAIECLGTDPLEYLVVPRFIAIVNASILLLVVGLLVSLAGSMLVALLVAGVNPLQYITSIPRFGGFSVFAAGMFKSMVYGTIVAGVACHQGFTASGGAKGVGKAVTWAAIYTNLYIVLANFVTSQLIDLMNQIFAGGH
ncbi:MAG: ABC transporter permease [Bdellovibrionales bacterium]|nr:ABC transporter permease [Bdellovibrionales bacterium]